MTLPRRFYARDNIIVCILIDREHELGWVASQFTRGDHHRVAPPRVMTLSETEWDASLSRVAHRSAIVMLES